MRTTEIGKTLKFSFLLSAGIATALISNGEVYEPNKSAEPKSAFTINYPAPPSLSREALAQLETSTPLEALLGISNLNGRTVKS